MATNRDERMKEITDRLQAGLEELFNSEKFAEYLRVMSQFHHYSFNNTLLIAMQKPDATLVAGYRAWEKKFNRHVMKGEKGIQIIAPAPIREKKEREKVDPNTGAVVLSPDGKPETEEVTVTIPRFKVSTVFDLAQTDGDPLPELGVEELTASVENFEIFMEAIRTVAPVPIRFDEIDSGAKGYYSNVDKEIVIQSGMGEMQTMKTAVHETAHAILHDKDYMQEQGIQKDQMTREVEAESVAFVTLAHFELDTSEYSFPYIAGWSSGRDTKELKASLDTIRRTSSEIIDGIETSMREQIRERQQEELNKAFQDKEVALEIADGYFTIQGTEAGFDYSFYDKEYHLLDGGVLEEAVSEEEPRSLRQAAEEILADQGKSLEECRVLPYEDFIAKVEQEQEAVIPDALSEQERLAVEIDQFVYDYDYYEYMDSYDSREEALQQLQETFDSGKVGGIREWLEEVVQDSDDPESVATARNLLERLDKIFPEKEPTRTFYVAECMEFPVMGEYHEVASLQEAIALYEQIPADRMHGIKGIGFNLDDGSDYAGAYPLMQGGKVVTEMIDLVEHFRNSPLVQQAVEEIRQHYPETSVTEHRTDHTKAPEEKGRDDDGGGRRASVLKALRERQAQVKENEKKAPEQKNHDRKRGEQTL